MTTPEAPVKPKGSYKLTKKQWEKAKAMWASGDYRLADIAAEFGLSEQGLHRRFTRHGIKKGQDKARQKELIQQKLAEREAERAHEIAQEMIDGKLLVVKAGFQLMKRLLLEYQQAAAAGEPIANRHPNIRALREGLAAIREGTAAINIVVDFKPEGGSDLEDMPILRVETMTPEDIAKMREEQRNQDAILNGELDLDDDIIEITDDEPENDAETPQERASSDE